MSKFEAVDRMMEMATGKRADPAPPHVPGEQTAAGALSEPESNLPAHKANSTAGRARAMFEAARPLLPVLARAIGQAESGPLRAASHLLPMLGGVLSAQMSSRGAGPAPEATPPSQPPSARSLELEAAHRDLAERVSTLRLTTEEHSDELRRVRTQLERLSAEHSATAGALRKVSDRLRLVTAAAVVLLMLLLAQLVVTVAVTHR
jgi:hypothetical protein